MPIASLAVAPILGFGPEIRDETVLFRLWAPKQRRPQLEILGHPPVAMESLGDGWFAREAAAGAGTRYRFVLDDGLAVPDPASRHQPEDVHGPSEVVDPDAYRWRAEDWRGRPWHEAVLYELHVGTFTAEGTFRAAAARLDHLAEIGVTAIEVMPVADFPGDRNWGYDGVLPYAPEATYGRPEDFKHFVDEAHARGLMVLLDVVYNHFGPDGNYLPAYSQIFTDRHHTPWGEAVNFDDAGSAAVREFIIGNALYWLTEFRLDGLRLDAVHEIRDDGGEHVLAELARRCRAAVPDRPIHLVLENEHNDPALLARDGDGAPALYTAQWDDDVHHVLHTAVTGERSGYYADYAGDTAMLARALGEGFAFQGETMPYRGSPRGGPSGELPPTAFVAFLQNHDQIGNRAFGDRIARLAEREAVRAAMAIILLSPQIPMLFQGEEWGAATPFQYFCGFTGDLAEAVRNGRRAEFARFPEFSDPASRERIPDPMAGSTFQNSKLDWREATLPGHAQRLAWMRNLLELRHREIVPLIPRIRRGGSHRVTPDGAVEIAWPVEGGGILHLAANLRPEPAAVSAMPGRRLWVEGEEDTATLAPGQTPMLAPWSVRWSVEEG